MRGRRTQGAAGGGRGACEQMLDHAKALEKELRA
jgi:hypothetical protein